MKTTTVREHLKAHHTVMEKHHRGMAADHGDLASEHDPKTELGKLHSSLAKHHEAVADHHLEMCEACDSMPASKGMSNADLDKIVPDQVRAVYPVGLTAVPRYGAPDTKANVPPELQQVVEISDD